MGYVEVTSTVVDSIYIISPYGIEIYEIQGEELPYCSIHTDKHRNTVYKTDDLTAGQLYSAFPISYITETLYSKMTAFQIRAIGGKILGIIQDDYYYKYYWGTTPYNDMVFCFAQKPNAAIRPVPPLSVCDGIVCNDKCIGYDLWSTVCADDVCINESLIEENSPTCGYIYIDPCEGVTCDQVCNNYDLWTQKCVDGSCVDDALVEQNSSICGYIPPDPCEGVVCDPSCTGYELWTQKCVDGTCINDTMIEQDSPTCGYIPPDESEWYDPITDYWGYILLLIAAGVAIDHSLE